MHTKTVAKTYLIVNFHANGRILNSDSTTLEHWQVEIDITVVAAVVLLVLHISSH